MNFPSDATHFSSVFPGVRIRVCTLSMNFGIPFFREVLLSMGLVSVSSESISCILGQDHGDTGPNACLIVVGGATEALLSRPNTNDLVLKRRRGFIKEALKNGASLVPIMSFGENNVYDQAPNPPGSVLHRIQTKMKELLSFSLPLFYGRGIFTNNYGLLPYRQNITSVVGAPITAQKIESPTDFDVDDLHRRYMDALECLYTQHRAKFEAPGCQPMRFVE